MLVMNETARLWVPEKIFNLLKYLNYEYLRLKAIQFSGSTLIEKNLWREKVDRIEK